MGGLLLKTWNLPEKRIPTLEYEKIKRELLTKFRGDVVINSPFFGKLFAEVAPSIRNKETHGDLDINISDLTDKHATVSWKEFDNFSEYLEKEFGYKPFKNSNVYSFPYDGFQVDVTFHPFDDFDMAVNYSSWGDLGNLMGRIFHKMGLHYGHAGLSFWIRQGLFDKNVQWSDNDHIYEKVVLSKNMKEICQIGGFDYDRWKQGFDCEQDAFDFVVDSKYFDKSLFDLESLNHTNRTRNRKRGMYMRFVEYVSTIEKKGTPFLSKYEYSLYMQSKFYNLNQAISRYRLIYEIDKIVKEKINGNLVMEWLNLSEKDGKLVGQIMTEIRKTNREQLLITSQEQLKDRVYEIFKNGQVLENT